MSDEAEPLVKQQLWMMGADVVFLVGQGLDSLLPNPNVLAFSCMAGVSIIFMA